MKEDLSELKTIPAHVGIIMDGNGRWAKKRGQMRSSGHLEGLKAAKRIAAFASDIGVKYLSYYVFSTENWRRAQNEVDFIMGLVMKYLREEFEFYKKNNIRVRHAGDTSGLKPDIAQEIRDISKETKDFNGMQIILALNYGGRDEIVRAVRRFLVSESHASPEKKALTEDILRRYLDNPDIPDPDLIIRTAGEQRTSNFLLWESAYSELYFSRTLWPDFSEADFRSALEAYANRERRFGAIAPAHIEQSEAS
ncbi:MAG: di-trans,poly-cis-decaprenylcistransferase [Spirochaetaceae bacterium]|jgi:undecaprenyl diphosphate synthase|nr:di-trans,poly-cis-decaprenylcistransferase [Spirochaetaceae bacterium]